MAGNEELINQVIADAVPGSVSNLKKLLADLNIEMVETIKNANDLNKATGNSTSFNDFQKNTKKSTDALNAAAIASEKLAQQQAKTQQANINLQKSQLALEQQTARQAAAQDKAAKSAFANLSPYQQLSKRLDELRAQAKNVAVTFGETSEQFQRASQPVKELDAKLKSIDQTLGQSQRNVGNYGSAFKSALTQYIPFGDGALKISENLKTLTGQADGAAEGIEGLGAGLGEFTVGIFVASIASATYFLSQFKSVGEATESKMAGLKNAFANFGQGLLPSVFGKRNGNVIDAYTSGKEIQKQVQELTNKQEVDAINDAELKAESEKNRALAADRTKDITDRIKYLKAAQDIESKILANQKHNADLTIQTALEVGFKSTSLNAKQIEEQKKILTAAAANGNLKPGQDLALDGLKFTSAGFDLYKQGLQQQIQYKTNAANQIVQLQSDANNQELKADRALAAAQNALDKSRIESAQQVAKLTLDSATASNTQKLAANRKYISDSIALINLEKENALETAGLGAGRTGKDSRVEAIQRQTIEQEAQNKINAITSEGMKTKQTLLKQDNDAELRLDKAKIESELDSAKVILDNQTSTYTERLKANSDYVDKSIELIDKERKSQLQAANLPSDAKKDDKTQAKTRAAIEQESQNAILKVRADGLNNLTRIVADNDNKAKTLRKITLDEEIDFEKYFENEITNIQNKSLQDIASTEANKQLILAQQYAKGKISRQGYEDELYSIENKSAQDRINLQIDTVQKLIDLEEKALEAGVTLKDGELQGNKDKLAGLKVSKTNLETSGTLHSGQAGLDKSKEKVQEFVAFAGEANKALDLAQQTVNANYENQIALLEKKSKLITDNAALEKQAIEDSLDTQTNKARREQILDAQTAEQQKQIQKEETDIKIRQAKFDKAISIAKITEETAVAVVSALSIPVYGEALAIVIGALGAAQLAIAAATPIPAFKDGGDHKGGLMIWGEAGVERAILPSGKSVFSPDGATLTSMPAGTKIIPHDQLVKPMKMNKWVSDSTGSNDVVSAVNNGLNRLNKTLTNQKAPRVSVFIEGDWHNYSKRVGK